MKRFVAYILLCFSVILSAFIGFLPTSLGINASADYDNGQNFVYKIDTKSDGTSSEEDLTTGKAIEEITDEFKYRLDKINISTYKLETEGTDTIKLSFKADPAIATAASKYLMWDWGFEAMNYKGDIMIESSEFFEQGDAYINYDSNYPVIVLPLKNPEDFKTKLYDNVKSADSTDDSTDEDTTDDTTANENYIYIVNNWNSTEYSLEDIIADDGANADTVESNSYLSRLDATKESELYFDYDSTDTSGKAFTELKYTDFLNNAGSDLALANKLANIAVNQFNCTEFDYDLTLINKDVINDSTNYSDPFIESLISHVGGYGSLKQITLSTLMISLIIALVIVILFLILNYGIASLTTISLTSSILVIVLAIFNSFGAEFNIGTIIALIATAIVSLFASIPYLKRIKEELYKGKSLKKANQEASRLSLPIQIDSSIITILLGIVAYLIPNTILLSAGATLILGGLFSALINIFGLRILMYFLTNSSFAQTHLGLLMVDKKLIPDLSKDQKPLYFDGFKKKDNKNSFKLASIISGVLLIASIIGLITFQSINGNIYNTESNSISGSRAYITLDYYENSDIKSTSDLETKVLNYLYTYNSTTSETSTKNVAYNDVTTYSYTYKENYKVNKEEQTLVYYIIDFSANYDSDTKISAYVDENNKREGVTLNDGIEYLLTKYNSMSNVNEVSIKSVVNVNNDSNNYYGMLFCLIGTAVVGIYFILRFAPSKGLTAIIIVSGAITITFGVFSLIRGNFSSQISLAAILLMIFGYLVLDGFLVKERNCYKEKHNEITTFEERKDNAIYSRNLSYSSIATTSLLSSFILISFFFNDGFTTYFIIFGLVGMAIILLLCKYLYIDIEFLFMGINKKMLLRINNRREQRKKNSDKNNKNKKGPKDDGPEEAIFIGIND
ncbi:MAG: hypothetical protein WCR97_01465 [Bacilli bacterium]